VLLVLGLAADRWRPSRERAALLARSSAASARSAAPRQPAVACRLRRAPLLTPRRAAAAASALDTALRATRPLERSRTRQELLDDDLRACRGTATCGPRATAYAAGSAPWGDLLAAIDRDPEAFLGGSDGDVRVTRQRRRWTRCSRPAPTPERVRQALGRGTSGAGEAGAAPRR
jgi:hypothetical protein